MSNNHSGWTSEQWQKAWRWLLVNPPAKGETPKQLEGRMRRAYCYFDEFPGAAEELLKLWQARQANGIKQ